MTRRIEKTVFISYRRTSLPWALLIYQNLHHDGYDVFFDYLSLNSGDYEQVILENIKAHTHFLVVLTPSSLDRSAEPGDLFRREIETALAEKRNIIPLFFDRFSFSDQLVSKHLTGKLKYLKNYNGVEIPQNFLFDAAMDRLKTGFLNIPLDQVMHPVHHIKSKVVKKATDKQKAAARKAAPVKLEKLTAQGWFEKAYKATNPGQKIRFYTEAIRLDPDNAAAYNNRGNALKAKGDLDGAIKDYSKAIRLKPKDALYFSNRGIAFGAKKDFDRAIKDYNKAIRLDPDNAAAYNNRGNALKAKGDLDGAIKDYSKAIRLKPKDALYFSNRGIAFGAKKDFDRAIKDYNKAIRLNPDNAAAYNNRGDALKTKGDLDGAIKDYSKAIRLDPKNAAFYTDRGLAFKSKKDLDRAIRDYNKAIRLDLNNAWAYLNRADARSDKDDFDGAIKDYNKAVRLDPNDEVNYYNRAIVWNAKRDYKSAIADYQKYLDLGGGRKYRDQKKVEKFIQDLKKKIK